MEPSLPDIHTITLKVLLVRDDHLVCALCDQTTNHYTHKFIVPLPANVRSIPVDNQQESTTTDRQQRGRQHGETKIARCIAYYNANPGLDKQQYINAFVTNFACTVQGANTYYHQCRKL